MNIRRATAADAAEICAIYNAHVTETIVSFETEIVSVDEMVARIEEKLHHHDWLVGVQGQSVIG